MKHFFLQTLCFISTVLCSTSLSAQTENNTVFKKIVDNNQYNFLVIKDKIIGYGTHATKIYDKEWNLLEAHDAGQSKLQTGTTTASRSYEYDSQNQKFYTKSWTSNSNLYDVNKYDFSIFNFAQFYEGEAEKLYFFKVNNDVFLNSHSVSTFSESLTGIAGKPSYVSNYYSKLATGFQIVDWDGNVISSTTFPYYCSYVSLNYLEVEDLAYIVVSALNEVYPTTIKKDIDLYSATPYDIKSYAVEVGYNHYFIYQFDKQNTNLKLIRIEKSESNDNEEVEWFGVNGKKLNNPSRGLNIIRMSDGTTKKMVLN